MLLPVRAESRIERLARLLDAWRCDRSQLTPDDIEWLLDRAAEQNTAQERADVEAQASPGRPVRTSRTLPTPPDLGFLHLSVAAVRNATLV